MATLLSAATERPPCGRRGSRAQWAAGPAGSRRGMDTRGGGKREGGRAVEIGRGTGEGRRDRLVALAEGSQEVSGQVWRE